MLGRTTLSFFILLASVCPAFAQTTRVVRLTTTDDVGIIGTYYPSTRDNAPAVLLLHGLNRDRSDWNEFALLLQKNGIAALAIDFRGHGESTRKLTTAGPVELKLQDFTQHDLQKMLLDVEAAVDWLQEQSEIDKKRIAIIGASLGANIAVRYAALNPDVAAVALLSPGLNYRGIRADDAIGQIPKMPVAIFVSHEDAYAFESSKRLTEIRRESGVTNTNKELMVCTGSLHGAALLQGVKNFPQTLLDWCRGVLFGEKTTTPAPPIETPATAPTTPK